MQSQVNVKKKKKNSGIELNYVFFLGRQPNINSAGENFIILSIFQKENIKNVITHYL
ncbi:hypothetical protein C0J52_23713 [Blattella germanica]|nr:hypothetical protein C0J52_23713 [Blattella germanica]